MKPLLVPALALTCIAAQATNEPVLNLAPGLWQLHQTFNVSHARSERTLCIRENDLALPFKPFAREKCDYTAIVTTTSAQRLHTTCPGVDSGIDGDFRLDVIDPKAFKAEFTGYESYTWGGERIWSIDQSLEAHRISAVCPGTDDYPDRSKKPAR